MSDHVEHLARELIPLMKSRAEKPRWEFKDNMTAEKYEQFYRLWRYGRKIPEEWEQLCPMAEDQGSRIIPVLTFIKEAIPTGDYEEGLSDTAKSGLFSVINCLVAAHNILEAQDMAFHECWAELTGKDGYLLTLEKMNDHKQEGESPTE